MTDEVTGGTRSCGAEPRTDFGAGPGRGSGARPGTGAAGAEPGAGDAAGGALRLVLVCDEAGRPRGSGFVADDRGTVITSHAAVDGPGRVVLHAPEGRSWPAGPQDVTPLPDLGLALVRTDGLGLRPLPVAACEEIPPGTYVRLPARGWRQARVLAAGAEVTYTAAGRAHLLPATVELAIGTDGRDALRRGAETCGGPVLDAETGAVLAVLGTALGTEHRSGNFAVPLRACAAAAPGGPLAALLERNSATVPGYGADLNLAGVLELTATALGSAFPPAPALGTAPAPDAAAEPVPRPAVAAGLAAFTTGERPVLGLVGAPGTGRTTALAALAADRARGPLPAPTLWLRGADLRGGDSSLADAVTRALEAAGRIVTAGGAGPVPQGTAERVAGLAAAAGRALLVVLDTPEEMPPQLAHRLAPWTGATAGWLRGTGARLVVAARPEYWEGAGKLYPPGMLHTPDRAARRLPPALPVGDLTPDEARTARARLGIPDDAVREADARHPLTLSLLAGIRAAGVTAGRPGRDEVFAAHLDLVALRVAVRIAVADTGRPPGVPPRSHTGPDTPTDAARTPHPAPPPPPDPTHHPHTPGDTAPDGRPADGADLDGGYPGDAQAGGADPDGAYARGAGFGGGYAGGADSGGAQVGGPGFGGGRFDGPDPADGTRGGVPGAAGAQGPGPGSAGGPAGGVRGDGERNRRGPAPDGGIPRPRTAGSPGAWPVAGDGPGSAGYGAWPAGTRTTSAHRAGARPGTDPAWPGAPGQPRADGPASGPTGADDCDAGRPWAEGRGAARPGAQGRDPGPAGAGGRGLGGAWDGGRNPGPAGADGCDSGNPGAQGRAPGSAGAGGDGAGRTWDGGRDPGPVSGGLGVVYGPGVRRLAARVAGRVHEAARRCLGPGQGQLDRASFEELFPWRTGWASAVLTEGLLVPAGPGYRFAHEELSDWLQAAHLDVPTALDALVHHGPATPGPPVPRHRIGPVLEALRRLPTAETRGVLNRLVGALNSFTEQPAEPDGPVHPDRVWWAARLLRGTLLGAPDAAPHLPVLHALAEHVARAGPGEFGGWFWNRIRLPESDRLDLLRRLLPSDHHYLEAAARRLVRAPRLVLPLVCAWFTDERRLRGRPGATVATAAQALLHTHRALAVDDLTEALVGAGHPRADELLAVLAEDEPSALSRAVHRWAHDERPGRRVAAAAYGLATAPHVRSTADRELLRHAAQALLARPGDAPLHGSALAVLLRDPQVRARYLPDALDCFRDPGSGARLPASALVAALPVLPDPDAVFAALRARADGEVLRALAALTTPGLARRAGDLVRDHLAGHPEDAPHAAAFVDRRLEQGPAAGPVLRALVLDLLRTAPSAVRSELARVLAAPGGEPSRTLRGELADVLLREEEDPSVLGAFLEALAAAAPVRPEERTRELLRRTGRRLLRAPGGPVVFEHRTVELARADPAFGALVARWLTDAEADAAALLGPGARRTVETLSRAAPDVT
ncbi:serine protease [Streptomyces lavendulae]|uniref:serine protease n=1 Tax=Streptomyces lavendulae TaxID=1914 RepID=UPI0033CD682F